MQGFGVKSTCRYGMMGLFALGLALGGVASAQPRSNGVTDDALSCPNAMELDAKTAKLHDPSYVREVAPSASTQPSKDLFSHARMAGLAYQLYDDFSNGQDPAEAFHERDLKLVGMIYGDPGPDTERRIRRKSTVTFYGFVADDVASGARYIVFRGTQEPAEWVRNMQAGQRSYPEGAPNSKDGAHVHAGFYKIFQSLKFNSDSGSQSFNSALTSLSTNRNVIFVGHSLGSALATFAGVEASQLLPGYASRFRIVTVASPRVGDEAFAKLAEKVGRIDRICNLADIVPAVPPSIKGLHYVHVGIPYKVSSFDQPKLVNDLKKDGDQIGCWHSDQSYDLMLNPNYVSPKSSVCVANPR